MTGRQVQQRDAKARLSAGSGGPPVLSGAHKKPGAAETARARHRRVQLPCTADLTKALYLALVEDVAMRDLRHTGAHAYPDVEAWIDYLDLDGKSARTQYAYERAVAPLLRRHPDKTVAEFTSADINAELRAIPPRSRYISRSIYNTFFEWALFDERIDRSPMLKVPKMTAGRRRPKDIFSPAEIAILEALPIPNGPLFTLMFGCGLRRAECRDSCRSWIDLDRMRMIVHGKGDKTRIVPFTPEVAAAVADLDLLERLEPTDHLWYRRRYPPGDRRRRGDPIGDTTFETWYRDMIELAGIRYLNPHQTRHTYHWWLRTDRKLDLEERQILMGHESPETTQRQYGRIDMEDLAAKIVGL
jgi:integrase/recombinase XerC